MKTKLTKVLLVALFLSTTKPSFAIMISVRSLSGKVQDGIDADLETATTHELYKKCAERFNLHTYQINLLNTIGKLPNDDTPLKSFINNDVDYVKMAVAYDPEKINLLKAAAELEEARRLEAQAKALEEDALARLE